MHWAKQSTAVSYVVGPILDSTGAEYASAVIGDLSLSKNGSTLTALASAATLTYVANGQYTLALTTGNTDTLGTARVLCNKSTYQMPTLELMVLPATVYDALTTNATNTTGGLPAATGAVSALAGAISTLTGAQAATAVWQDTTAGDFTTALSVGKSLMNGVTLGTGLTVARCTLVDTLTTYTSNTPQTGDSFALIGATGSGLTSLAPSATALSTATWTSARAGYLDNINNATLPAAVFPTDPADQSLLAAIGNAILAVLGTPAGASLAADIATRLAAASYTAPPTAAAVATAWGTRDIGNGRTADMYLQGLVNKIAFAADGLTFTIYGTDDSTPLFVGTAARLATSVGGLMSVDPT